MARERNPDPRPERLRPRGGSCLPLALLIMYEVVAIPAVLGVLAARHHEGRGEEERQRARELRRERTRQRLARARAEAEAARRAAEARATREEGPAPASRPRRVEKVGNVWRRPFPDRRAEPSPKLVFGVDKLRELLAGGRVPPALRLSDPISPRATDRVDDAILAELASLPGLRSLILGRLPGVTDVGLRALAQHPALEVLDLQSLPGITDAGVAALGKISTLRVLRLYQNPTLTDAALAGFAGHARLERATVRGAPGKAAQLGDEGLALLAALPRLWSLRWEGTAATGRLLDRVIDAGPRHLAIHDSPLAPEALAKIGGWDGLSQLELVEVGLTGRALRGLVDHPGLTQLTLVGWSLEGDDLAPLSNLPKLVNLRLESCRGFPGTSLAPLRELPSLGILNLKKSDVRAADLVPLAGAPRLGILDLRGCPAAGPGLAPVVAGLGLKSLVVSRGTDAATLKELRPLFGPGRLRVE